MQPELASARVSTYRSIIMCPTRAEFKLVAVDQTLELKQTHRQSTMANQRLATVFPELDGRRLPSLRRHELASCCSRLGLVSSGNRHALLSRLSTALQAGAQIPPPPGQPTVPTTSSVLSPPADAQTSLVSTGNLLPRHYRRSV